MSARKGDRPKISIEQATVIAKELYAVIGELSEYPSERDRNYLIHVDNEPTYVLKISASYDSKETIEFQNKAIEHMLKQKPDIQIPRIIPSQKGEKVSIIEDDSGMQHMVRLFSYVPGREFAKVFPRTPDFLEDYGRFLGQVSQALIGYDHPAIHRDFVWDLKNAPRSVKDLMELIEDSSKQEIVDYMYSLFDRSVIPKIRDLRESALYNDANDYNVLVSKSSSDTERKFGIIDFGDMVYSCTVFDLAIGIAYAILDNADPLIAASHIVYGYNKIFPLTETEISTLFPLICMRLTQSVCISAHQIKLEPDNEYLRISEAPAWRTLEKLRLIHPRLAEYAFRDACGLSAHPNSPSISEWLQLNQSEFSKILPVDWEKTVITDLGVGSYDYASPDEVQDIVKFTRWVTEKINSCHAECGIGRYNEARLIYTDTQYKSIDSNLNETRSVHIGMDFFVEKSTPVLAPLDGTVFSIRNNDSPHDYGPTIILEHKPADGIHFFTLYGHLSMDSLQNISVGQKIKKRQEFANVGDYPINGGWPPHLHFQIIIDMFDFEGDYYGSCLPSQRSLWTNLCPDPNLIVGIPNYKFPPNPLAEDEILRIRHDHFGRNLSVSYKKPIKVVRGYMQHLYDEDGRKYLDCVNNVPHVGHSHPKVVKAIQDQAKVLYTNTRYLHDNLALYAKRLASKFPEPLSVCFFVNSGSEANELAIRLAKTHTGRDGFIALTRAYHGNTDNLIGLSHYKHASIDGVEEPDNVQVVIDPDTLGRLDSWENARGELADGVKTGIDWIAERGHPVAAFICEPVMSCAGQVVLPPKYLQNVYKHIREAGGVCIADEVQTGFGRMGTHFWAFETQGVIPDIVTLGKPIGNGHPLAAVITTPEIADSFNNGMEFFSTTGGNTVSCAVGLAVLDVIESENLQENARVVGEYLKNELLKLQKKHPLIYDVRGYGLFLGIELVKQDVEEDVQAHDEAKYIVNRMRELGVLMSVDGPMRNVLKIKPPMVFQVEDVDHLVAVLDLVLSEDLPSGRD